MQLLYSLDMTRLEHNILCNGVGARFNLSGKYLGNDARVLKNSVPSDAFSLLQQGTLCEVAVLTSDNYIKRVVDYNRVQAWLKTLPLQPKGVFTLKRQVGEVKCTQTLYIFNYGRLGMYLGSLL